MENTNNAKWIKTSEQEPEQRGQIIAFTHFGFGSFFEHLEWEEGKKVWVRKGTENVVEKMKDGNTSFWPFRFWQRLDWKEVLKLQDE